MINDKAAFNSWLVSDTFPTYYQEIAEKSLTHERATFYKFLRDLFSLIGCRYWEFC